MDNEQTVRAVKDRTDIVEIIGSYVKLRKKGKNFWGLCPFHDEKTGSFSVSYDNQFYHCFGCGVGGDVFNFLMSHESWTFYQALEFLANRCGIELKHESGGDRAGKSKDIKNILETALDFFKKNLTSSEGAIAAAYLKRRKLTPEAFETFELGFSPMDWQAFTRTLSHEQMPLAKEYGLIVQGERGVYDKFRGRLIYPIRTESGAMAGFGARILEGEGAKYLNSPESPSFSKKRLLYGLHLAKRAIREKGCMIIVEGYMDAIRCQMSGFKHAVACMGTALTEEQAKIVSRLVSRAYLCFDADSAGKEAAIKGMYALHAQGVDTRVVRIEGGKDPDELLCEEGGREAFAKAIDDAMPIPIFHAFVRSAKLKDPYTKKAAAEEILDAVSSISAIDMSFYLDKLAAYFEIMPHELKDLIRVHAKNLRNARNTRNTRNDADDDFWSDTQASNTPLNTQSPAPSAKADWQAGLCALLWQDKNFRQRAVRDEILPLFEEELHKSIAWALLSGEEPHELENRWQSSHDAQPLALLASGSAFLDALHVEDDIGELIIAELKKIKNKKRYDQLHKKILRQEILSEAEKKEYMTFAYLIKRQ